MAKIAAKAKVATAKAPEPVEVKKTVADFRFNHEAGISGVTYHTFKDKDKKISIPDTIAGVDGAKRYMGACFSNLSYQIDHQYKTHNRIHYQPKFDVLDKKEVVEWIDFCVAQGILPEYIEPKSVLKGMVLNLSGPRSLTYVHLCLIRFVSEEPTICRAVMHLVKEEKVNVFAALVLTARTLTCGANHHFLEAGSGWGQPKGTLDGYKVPLRNVIGLRNFFADAKEYDNEQSNFAAKAAIDRAIAQVKDVPADLTMKWSHFTRPSIIKAMNAQNSDQLKAAVAQYKRGVAAYKKKLATEKAAKQPLHEV